VTEGAVEFLDVELGVVGNDEIGICQKWEQFLRDRRELRRIQNVLVRDAMDLDEILKKPAMSPWRTNQPMAGFDQFPVNKHRNPGGTDARVRVVRCFKIKAADFHSLPKVLPYQGSQADIGPVSIVKSHGAVWQNSRNADRTKIGDNLVQWKSLKIRVYQPVLPLLPADGV